MSEHERHKLVSMKKYRPRVVCGLNRMDRIRIEEVRRRGVRKALSDEVNRKVLKWFDQLIAYE